MIFLMVSGAPHSGKSIWLESFISRNADKRMKIIDIYHVQHQFIIETDEDVYNAYICMMQELKFTLTEHHEEYDVAIVEAPLLTQADRSLFSSVFHKISQPGDHSVLVWCSTDDDTLRRRLTSHQDAEYDVEDVIARIERPFTQEGYDCVVYCENAGDSDPYINLARIHCGIDTVDPAKAREAVKRFETDSDANRPRGLVYVIEDQKEGS